MSWDGPILNHLGMTLDSTVPGEVAKFVSDLASQNPDLKLYDAHTSSSLIDEPPADDPLQCFGSLAIKPMTRTSLL